MKINLAKLKGEAYHEKVAFGTSSRSYDRLLRLFSLGGHSSAGKEKWTGTFAGAG